MIQPHETITIGETHYRMISEEAFLSLVSLARQVRAKVKVVKNKATAAQVEDEHVELALKALQRLGTAA